MLRLYTILWSLCLVILGYEFYTLNHNPASGLFYFLKTKKILSPQFNLSPQPGRQISLWLGYLGFGIMCLTNLYVLRKRFSSLKNLGKVRGWLDFHIFCGLIGPTLIVFHCNFKVGGLVAISFWSMIISFLSGIVGRYFYINLLHKQQEGVDIAKRQWEKFVQYAEKANFKSDAKELKLAKDFALAYVGHPGVDPGVFSTLMSSLIGDIKLFFAPPPTIRGLPEKTRYILKTYALARRHSAALVPFQQLMGYWHAFHLPFAIFMYVVAVIHIIAAIFFGV